MSRKSTLSILFFLPLLTVLWAGCTGAERTCRNHGDCPADHFCAEAGGVLFAGGHCLPEDGSRPGPSDAGDEDSTDAGDAEPTDTSEPPADTASDTKNTSDTADVSAADTHSGPDDTSATDTSGADSGDTETAPDADTDTDAPTDAGPCGGDSRIGQSCPRSAGQMGIWVCEGGRVVCRLKKAEVCDDKDNDYDGKVDEGLQQRMCTCLCDKSQECRCNGDPNKRCEGRTFCQNGSWTPCLCVDRR